MRRLLLVATPVIALSMPATADQMPTSYLCEVKNAYDLSEGGDIKRSANRAYVGDRFQVNIKTGEMLGAGAFSSRGWATISVLDHGTSSGTYLKVMYSSPSPDGTFTNAGYLQIEGEIEQSRRPFLYNWADLLFSGVCSAAF